MRGLQIPWKNRTELRMKLKLCPVIHLKAFKCVGAGQDFATSLREERWLMTVEHSLLRLKCRRGDKCVKIERRIVKLKKPDLKIS